MISYYIYLFYQVKTFILLHILLYNHANSPPLFFDMSSTICCWVFFVGFRLYFSSMSNTSFSRLPISISRAFSACSSIVMFCFKELIVSGSVYSTRIPPTTFQHRRSPSKGWMFSSTKLFSLLSSSN